LCGFAHTLDKFARMKKFEPSTEYVREDFTSKDKKLVEEDWIYIIENRLIYYDELLKEQEDKGKDFTENDTERSDGDQAEEFKGEIFLDSVVAEETKRDNNDVSISEELLTRTHITKDVVTMEKEYLETFWNTIDGIYSELMRSQENTDSKEQGHKLNWEHCGDTDELLFEGGFKIHYAGGTLNAFVDSCSYQERVEESRIDLDLMN
jgi:hypothetical protein